MLDIVEFESKSIAYGRRKRGGAYDTDLITGLRARTEIGQRALLGAGLAGLTSRMFVKCKLRSEVLPTFLIGILFPALMFVLMLSQVVFESKSLLAYFTLEGTLLGVRVNVVLGNCRSIVCLWATGTHMFFQASQTQARPS